MKNEMNTLYDQRYLQGYRTSISAYEAARRTALAHYIISVLKIEESRKVLDYGSGNGLHVDLWNTIFSQAELHFCDISSVALKQLQSRYPQYADRCHLVSDNRTDADAGSFDVAVSVEVMEHVEDLTLYLQDVRRLLKPGGYFIWTTPCGNALSAEHIYASITKKINRTTDGYRRWYWEDPTHLRRLKSREIKRLLESNGFSRVQFRFRAHVFSSIAAHVLRPLPTKLKARLAMLDYTLLRRLPNGASMLGIATKSS